MSSLPETQQLAEFTAVDPSAMPFVPSTGLRTGSAQDKLRASLRVYLLGPPEVEWASRPLPIPRRQVRALLYRLATQLQPVPREQLCFLFWPDTPESAARRHFSRLLTHLRLALPDPEVLLASDDQVGLDPQRAWSDTAAFEPLCANLTPLPPKRVRGEVVRVEALQQAVDLYRGSFLSGFSLSTSPEFETWAALERQVWERLYLEALAALIEEWTIRGEYNSAITCALRYLQTDDLAEDIHRRLIELYAVAGDRCAALRQFERCAVVLERELGVSPLPEIQAAYQSVLQGRPVVRQSAPLPTWTTLPSLEAPLVGRDEALNWLAGAYTRARLGHGGVVLISGEPGIGKSRLMQDFVTDLRGEATVMVGSGHETEQGLPYWPLIEALSSCVPVMGQAALEVEPRYLAQVARILPELRTLYPNLPAPIPVDPGQEHGYLCDAVVHWLQSLAAQHPPLVLCLDDLHWADEATLSWLGYLSRRIKGAPILVLGTYRTEEVAAITKLRTQLARLGLLQEVRLEGLPQADVLRLIRHLSGKTCRAERFSQRLHRETGGNPFFLLETLRAMFEAGILWQDETGWSTGVDETTKDYRELPLPDTVCQAIRDRLSRLSPQARQVLEAGAVLGHQFDLDMVRQTSGRREGEAVDALDTLLVRQVISERDGTYRFNHDLIRTVVYRDLSYGRRRLLHRRVGEALVKRQSEDVAALAWHFERAEEPRRAAEYALQASQRARAVFAYAAARAHADKALALLQREAADLCHPEEFAANQHLQIQALHERGWVLRLLGEMEAYARDSQEIARLAQVNGLDDRRALAQVRWREAHAHRWFCRYTEALAVAEDGVRLSQAASDPLSEAICWREAGLAAREIGDYPQAQAALEQALSLFVELGNAEYEIHVLGNLSTLHCYQGEYQEALALARRELVRCEEAGLSFNRRLALGDMGAAAAVLGDVDLARQWLQESLAIARQAVDRTQEIFCLGHLGWLAVQRGQPAEALEQLEAALALAERLGSRREQSWLHSGLAEVHRLAGDHDQAVAHARRALELAQACGRAYDQALARRVLAGLASTDR